MLWIEHRLRVKKLRNVTFVHCTVPPRRDVMTSAPSSHTGYKSARFSSQCKGPTMASVDSHKPSAELMGAFNQSGETNDTFRNASLHRHFGGSRDSFGRTPIYIPPNKQPGLFGKLFGKGTNSDSPQIGTDNLSSGGAMQALGRWSGNEKKEAKGYSLKVCRSIPNAIQLNLTRSRMANDWLYTTSIVPNCINVHFYT
jgi:hypothetical protein